MCDKVNYGEVKRSEIMEELGRLENRVPGVRNGPQYAAITDKVNDETGLADESEMSTSG